MLSEQAIAKLIDTRLVYSEGYRNLAYDDKTGKTVFAPVGKLTIGIGWNIQDSGCPIELAKIITAWFLKKYDAELENDLYFYGKLDEVRKCVLLECAYNMGVAGIELFKKSLNLASQGFFKNAAIEMRRSRWYSQDPKRAEKLCIMMETGEWISEK